MDEFVTLDSVYGSDIFPNFGHLVFKYSFTKKQCIYFLGNFNGYDSLLTGLRVVQFGL